MRIFAYIFYCIGAGLLIASCFTTGASLTWWLGASALVALIVGFIFQYNAPQSPRR